MKRWTEEEIKTLYKLISQYEFDPQVLACAVDDSRTSFSELTQITDAFNNQNQTPRSQKSIQRKVQDLCSKSPFQVRLLKEAS
jgi:hypothetical protein